MKRNLEPVVALACLAFVAACTDPGKAPAESAMRAAEAEASQLGGDVARLAPAQAKAAEDALAAARRLMARKDYQGALAGASAVPSKVKEAVAAAAARKDEVAKAWAEASRDVQNLVYAVDDRLDMLSGAKKLPRGLDRSAIVWAQASLAAIEASWSKAQDQFRSGDTAGAVARAHQAKGQASEILQKIGMP